MKHLKLYEEFNEDEMEVIQKPDNFKEDAATITVSDVKDGGRTRVINQTQFNQGGALRYSDFPDMEKPEDETSPFLKQPGEDFDLNGFKGGEIIVYQGTSWKVLQVGS